MQINPANFLMHHMGMVLTVTTLVSVVAASISVGVIVAQQINSFQNQKIVLQSPATIILNRFIEAYELPLFYDAVGTMTMFLESIKQVLRDRFGDKFLNIEVQSFSTNAYYYID